MAVPGADFGVAKYANSGSALAGKSVLFVFGACVRMAGVVDAADNQPDALRRIY